MQSIVKPQTLPTHELAKTWQARAEAPEDVVAHVQSDQHVFLHGGCAVSQPLEQALAVRAARLSGIMAVQMHKEGPEPLADPGLEGHVRIKALFCGQGVRQAVAEGRADYVPVFLSEIPELFRSGALPLDVALVQLSPPDAHGWCTLGCSVDVALQAFRSARIRLAEINARMPRTLGAGMVHLSELTAWTVTDRPLVEHPQTRPDRDATTIGQLVAGMVPEGATLQTGIGNISDAVLAALHGQRDLRIHTEMFSDALVDLHEAGAIAYLPSEDHAAPVVTSFVLGTGKVMDFVADHPAVRFKPSDVTNDTALIRRKRRMIAINSALQIDLTGQVCADSIGTRIYSGIGGQMDFIRGAALAEEGKAIIALPSTAVGGTRSRIVPTLEAGAGVVTTRGHVQYVVTEYGIANLWGRSLRERALALVAIAHPDHREDLRRHAVERRLFGVGALD